MPDNIPPPPPPPPPSGSAKGSWREKQREQVRYGYATCMDHAHSIIRTGLVNLGLLCRYCLLKCGKILLMCAQVYVFVENYFSLRRACSLFYQRFHVCVWETKDAVKLKTHIQYTVIYFLNLGERLENINRKIGRQIAEKHFPGSRQRNPSASGTRQRIQGSTEGQKTIQLHAWRRCPRSIRESISELSSTSQSADRRRPSDTKSLADCFRRRIGDRGSTENAVLSSPIQQSAPSLLQGQR